LNCTLRSDQHLLTFLARALTKKRPCYEDMTLGYCFYFCSMETCVQMMVDDL
jgi:hypothetical protein